MCDRRLVALSPVLPLGPFLDSRSPTSRERSPSPRRNMPRSRLNSNGQINRKKSTNPPSIRLRRNFSHLIYPSHPHEDACSFNLQRKARLFVQITEGKRERVEGAEEEEGEKKEEGFSRFLPKRGRGLANLFPGRGSGGGKGGEKEPPIKVYTIEREMRGGPGRRETETGRREAGVQAGAWPGYRLWGLPREDWRDPAAPAASVLRLLASQLSLALLYLTGLLLAATAFHLCEGPNEYLQREEVNRSQSSLAVSLATDLRVLEDPQGPNWRETIEEYLGRQEELLLDATSVGYSREGFLWTYSGSLLFTVTLLTILGYGGPSPQTTAGEVTTLVVALLGIPLHFLLAVNLASLLKVKLHLFARELEVRIVDLKRRIQSAREGDKEAWPEEVWQGAEAPRSYLGWASLLWMVALYLLGALILGGGQGLGPGEALLFPFSFTPRGGLALTSPLARLGYALFLESALISFLLTIQLLRAPPRPPISLLPTAIALRLVTDSLE